MHIYEYIANVAKMPFFAQPNEKQIFYIIHVISLLLWPIFVFVKILLFCTPDRQTLWILVSKLSLVLSRRILLF